MREKITYICEVCHTEYADKETASRCEGSHVLLKELKIVGAKYLPLQMRAGSQQWPSKITLQASDGSTREYRA